MDDLAVSSVGHGEFGRMINFSEILWKPRQARADEPRSRPFTAAEEPETRAPLLEVAVEHARWKRGSRLAMLTDSRSASADRFRYIRMRLRELRELAKLQRVVVTSALSEDGKSTVAMCLATVLAEEGKHSTLLIEADLHHPSIASGLGLPPGEGLAECIQADLDPMSAIRKVEPLSWYLLRAGDANANPSELLQSEKLAAILQNLSSHFEWIIIDSPPALPLADAVSLSRQADATLLVARADRTPRGAVEEVINLIGQKHIVGIVLNGAEGLNRLYSAYHRHYGKS